ncbi:MAG: chemotaxis-specific protein-glutamate methyltransferase CheB [Sphingobacteriia bacterium]|nr:chemotaxis-specific protein-glutamate methyltransferase CheB [Sphingobacteriia bacterium]NCC39805.1 chemotaxis-specific protein-glutamate methyltransferase CheB [Gammaproteobacteria bacterium]
MRQVRVLIVDDSRSARSLIRALLESTEEIEVCGEASNGREAVALNLSLCPDIITMDLRMPEMDGIHAIASIMAQRAVPILVLSDVADAHNAMAAVACGALEAAPKPTLDEGASLAKRVRMLARIPVIRHIRHGGTLARPDPTPLSIMPSTSAASGFEPSDRIASAGAWGGRVVAIVSSTGGPQALARLLPALPANFPAPILIAQHISDGFAAAMADWLDELCALRVAIACDDEPIVPGRVYLADASTHMTLGAGGRIRLVQRAETDIYRPSCDRLLTSLAERCGRDAIGVILTGMGRDGALGISNIAQAGGLTIAQDEASSVIYGMNREAILAGGVQWILPLDLIAGELMMLTRAPMHAEDSSRA